MPADKRDARVAKVSHLLDDKRLLGIQKQPGVIAVLAFYEGFPVKAVGSGDFEQVAAIAEDFLRAGEKITGDMRMGALRQIILEAGEKKCVIVPYGDLFLCLIAKSETNLGLIRVAIRNLQAMER
ncbi:MAG: roadblock/LC7 domain-containing protein [Methanoregulaceae archaeon]|nr:roadblock/LC7 domain-containing protein [Methanoregulaceae archaeon]